MFKSLSVLCLCLAPAASGQTAEIRTPKPGAVPQINGPKVYGARPGHPFLYRIPCTGSRPMRFEAKGLPKGLTLDAKQGILSGSTPAKGEYRIELRARNAAGKASREFKLVAGDKLALTPPMGWNDWYTHYARVTDKLMRQAADVMIESGMADAGYQYVNIDDCWMRSAEGEILPNARFPDMKALSAYIHSKGLKAGLYTSPGPATCGKFEGSWQHEEQDGKTFAAWGFDFLKYDWCGYRTVVGGKTLADLRKPYDKMGAILKQSNRDIVFNLCQYGMGDVWQWGGETGGNCWRTTGDLGLEKDSRLPGFYSIGMSNAKHSDYAKPGEWNDPDYILIGYVGNARKQDAPPLRSPLTPDEQYSYMSMWSLMASPLFYSGDMGRLDEFTLNVLTNSEVIAVNQDELGKQAKIVRQTADELVLAKPLSGGDVAVGLFNLGDGAREMSVSAEEIGVSGKPAVRDVWRQKPLGRVDGAFKANVARHGVEMIRVSAR
jgi:alpha-galactosidase